VSNPIPIVKVVRRVRRGREKIEDVPRGGQGPTFS